MECPECDNLLCRCEALVSSAARLKSAMKTAEQVCDAEALARLRREMERLTASLLEARDAFSRHQHAVHENRLKARAAGGGGRFIF